MPLSVKHFSNYSYSSLYGLLSNLVYSLCLELNRSFLTAMRPPRPASINRRLILTGCRYKLNSAVIYLVIRRYLFKEISNALIPTLLRSSENLKLKYICTYVSFIFKIDF